MKASAKDIQSAVALALRDVKGDPNTDWYYTSDTKLEFWAGPAAALREENPVIGHHVVQGTLDIKESFILHLAIILSGEAYSVGYEGFPSLVEVPDMLSIRKELLKNTTSYEDDGFFEIMIDALNF